MGRSENSVSVYRNQLVPSSPLKELAPAAIHIDGSVLPQLIDGKEDLLFREIVKSFWEETGCPAIINTSFNLCGEPIVCSPEDALQDFLRSEIDTLIIGNFAVDKSVRTKF